MLQGARCSSAALHRPRTGASATPGRQNYPRGLALIYASSHAGGWGDAGGTGTFSSALAADSPLPRNEL